jgi:hypothetical protein
MKIFYGYAFYYTLALFYFLAKKSQGKNFPLGRERKPGGYGIRDLGANFVAIRESPFRILFRPKTGGFLFMSAGT